MLTSHMRIEMSREKRILCVCGNFVIIRLRNTLVIMIIFIIFWLINRSIYFRQLKPKVISRVLEAIIAIGKLKPCLRRILASNIHNQFNNFIDQFIYSQSKNDMLIFSQISNYQTQNLQIKNKGLLSLFLQCEINYIFFILFQTLSMSGPRSSLTPNKQQFDALAKVAVIGDSSVGKTNILLRYINSDYQMTHITTIGIDFKVKTLAIDGFKLKMQIWDTAGQERFRNLSGTIYQGAEAIILVYSIASRKTFDNVETWIKDITDKAHGSILLAIIGNKCDLAHQREVSKEQGMQIAKKFNAQIFMQTSAKEGINIDELFNEVGRKIKQKIDKQNAPPAKKSIQPPAQQTKVRSKTVASQSQKPAPQSSKNGKVKLTTASQKQKEKKKKSCC